MGHIHAHNIAEHLLHVLLRNRNEEILFDQYGEYKGGGGLTRKKILPLIIKKEVKFLSHRLKIIKKALNKLDSSHDHAKLLLWEMAMSKYGFNASDRSSDDPLDIQEVIEILLSIWQEKKIVYQTEKGWFLDIDNYYKYNYDTLANAELDM